MTAAALGAEVGIYVDLIARVEPGDAIVTPTGRTYMVVRVRVQARGKHAGRRQHLRCIVAESAPAGVTVHRIVWYARGPRRDGSPVFQRHPRV